MDQEVVCIDPDQESIACWSETQLSWAGTDQSCAELHVQVGLQALLCCTCPVAAGRAQPACGPGKPAGSSHSVPVIRPPDWSWLHAKEWQEVLIRACFRNSVIFLYTICILFSCIQYDSILCSIFNDRKGRASLHKQDLLYATHWGKIHPGEVWCCRNVCPTFEEM